MKRFVSIPILLALMLGGCTSGIPDGAESAPDGMPSVEVLSGSRFLYAKQKF